MGKRDLRKAVLVDRGGDMSKPWYITYYAIDRETGKAKRLKYTQGINQIKDERLRRLKCRQLIIAIERSLAQNPFLDPAKLKTPAKEVPEGPDLSKDTLIDALRRNVESNAESRSGCQRSRVYLLKVAQAYYQNRKAPTIKGMRVPDYFHFLEYLERKPIAASTWNQYYHILTASVQFYVLMDVLKENLVKKIPRRKVVKGHRNTPFSMDELQRIFAQAEAEGETNWIYFAKFMLYTLARPWKELLFLKAREIRENDIYIPPERGKTGGRSIPIVPALRKLIEEMGIRQMDPDAYIFQDRRENKIGLRRETYYKKPFYRILKKLGMDGQGHTMYALKHTGACVAYDAGMPIHVIQTMTGHATISQTEEYMRSMGRVVRNKLYIDQWPELNL